MSNYRNRALLDLAHSIHFCMHCAGHAPDGCEPAHANWSAYGKGMSIKAHDCYFAALCHRCHAELDQGPVSREDKQAMWRAAFDRTLLTLWEQGMVRVA